MPQFPRHVASVVRFATVAALAFGCSESSRPNESPSGAQGSAASQTQQLDHLAIASRAFVGEPPVSEIKPVIDRALELHGDVPRTNENYGRAASALVALRKSTGISEMRILNHMIRSHVPGVKLSFAEAAGLSASFLKAGDG